MRQIRTWRVSGLACVAVAGSVGLAAGQTLESNTPLPQIRAGGTVQPPSQLDMSRSIDAVCPTLVLRRFDPGGNMLAEGEAGVLDVCTGMTSAAALLLGPDDPSTIGFLDFLNGFDELVGALDANRNGQIDLEELTPVAYGFAEGEEDKLVGAVQQISGEEFQTGQSELAEIRAGAARAIGARLAAIRAGARGLTVAGLPVGDGTAFAFDAPALGTAGAARTGQGTGLSDAFLGRLGGFVSGGVAFGSKDGTDQAGGFDFTSPGIAVGADYRISEEAVIGAAFSYDHVGYDFDTSLSTAAGQDLETDSFLFSLYGTASLTDRIFVEGIVSAGFANHGSTRRIVIPGSTAPGSTLTDADATATADYGSTQFAVALGGGYDIVLGGATITPLATVEYVHADIDGVRETGAGAFDLRISDSEVDSFTSQIGAQAAYPISTGFGIVQPYARGEWFHEFLNDDDGASIVYANDSTGTSLFEITTEEVDRNYGVLGGGVAVTLPNGIVGFVEGSATVGLQSYDVYSVTGGVRVTF